MGCEDGHINTVYLKISFKTFFKMLIAYYSDISSSGNFSCHNFYFHAICDASSCDGQYELIYSAL